MLAFAVGLTLGVVFALLGAGGGILAVPALMVVFSESMTVATGAGLAVVFAAAVAGSISHGRAKRVDWRVAGLFGAPSIVGAIAGARLHALVPERVTMGLFALVLLSAVASMLRARREGTGTSGSTPLLLGVGFVTGVLTGFLGVGGGFLIVPALTVFAAVPLHRAIGTSMAVIAASSLSGAITHLVAGHVPLELVAPMAAGAVMGALIGAPLSGRLPEKPLKIERLAAFVDEKTLTVHHVLETHAHADHLSGSQWLKKRYGAKVGISERITEVQGVFKDVFALDELPTDGRQFDVLLKDQQVLKAGSVVLNAIATPGHTPACMSFQVGDAVFTGDALFLDDVGVGRCDFPKGDAAALYDSVVNRLFSLPDTTRLFVGHDYPPAGRTWRAMTTVGSAKQANAQLTSSMSKPAFVEKRTARDRTLSPPRLLYPSVQVNIAAGQLPAPKPNGRRYLVTPLTGL